MDPTPESVRAYLESLLSSEAFSKSAGTKRLLGYLVERSLTSSDGPKEIEIAIDVFGRDPGFTGAEDSAVRVAMRTLRHKLLEHYAGEGKRDALVIDIPKGAYRVTFTPRAADPPPAQATPSQSLTGDAGAAAGVQAGPERRWRGVAVLLGLALVLSLLANIQLWATDPARDDAREPLLSDPFWEPLARSPRPLVFVLGDLFMYTQTDPETGRTQTVRDTLINSSDDLRAFLATKPALAADRGLRYATLIQKSTAVGMVQILQLLDRPGKRIEVRLRDELQAEDIRTSDIVYVGPLTRIGPLASDNHVRSRYRFDATAASITDLETGMVHTPEGDLGAHHKDYALVARYPGPTGNQIMVFTAGGRNAGLLQIVRTLTSPEGLSKFRQSAGARDSLPDSFEAVMAVTGYKQTDLSADLIQLHPLEKHP